MELLPAIGEFDTFHKNIPSFSSSYGIGLTKKGGIFYVSISDNVIGNICGGSDECEKNRDQKG